MELKAFRSLNSLLQLFVQMTICTIVFYADRVRGRWNTPPKSRNVSEPKHHHHHVPLKEVLQLFGRGCLVTQRVSYVGKPRERNSGKILRHFRPSISRKSGARNFTKNWRQIRLAVKQTSFTARLWEFGGTKCLRKPGCPRECSTVSRQCPESEKKVSRMLRGQFWTSRGTRPRTPPFSETLSETLPGKLRSERPERPLLVGGIATLSLEERPGWPKSVFTRGCL